MNPQVNQLPEDPAKLKQIVAKLLVEYERLQEKVQYLEEHNRVLKNEIFGRKSEKPPLQDRYQYPLFEADEDSPHPEDESSQATRVSGHTRKKRGRKPLPVDLPREDVIHDINPAIK